MTLESRAVPPGSPQSAFSDIGSQKMELEFDFPTAIGLKSRLSKGPLFVSQGILLNLTEGVGTPRGGDRAKLSIPNRSWDDTFP